jgi:hypothetical protein
MRGLGVAGTSFALAALALVPATPARVLGEAGLRRPLHLPHVAPGAPCPISHADATVDFARFGVARGLGHGPAYPIGMPRGVLVVVPASGADAGSDWAGQKVLWFVRPRYGGRVLVRGRRLDGPGLVRFGRGSVPATELLIPAGTMERPSFTRVRASGCYAYQIDGTSFSRTIVFRATGAP